MKRHNKSVLTKEQFNEILKDESKISDLLSSFDRAAVNSAAVFACNDIISGSTNALSFLSRAAKKQSVKKIISERLCKSDFYKFISNENPKVRKNTAKLLGLLKDDSYAELLINALYAEKIRMVIPSIILALGAVGGERAKAAIEGYEVNLAKDETEIKHEKEERAAKEKALSAFLEDYNHEFSGFENTDTLQAICANRTARFVADDFIKNGITVKSYSDSTVDISGGDTNAIYNVRGFRELLIPIVKSGELDLLKERLLFALNNTHEKSEKPYKYRIEYRGNGDKINAINTIINAVSCKLLINSTSDYEIELRVYNDLSVKLKLFTYCDSRFAYRKNTISASIHPANAASVMSFAKRYFKEGATVLDMCCGSGTMLFERELLLPAKRLIGVDITERAIKAAKSNAFSNKFIFYHADCTRFTLKERVDEIVSNLPFGNRIGTHENNEKLYNKIFENMLKWLKTDGIAVLYTMEYSFIKELVKKYEEFEIIDSLKTEAGGLMPVVCVIKRVK